MPPTSDLNPQQKLAAEAPSKPLLIVAGAGTGKTRTLTSRLVHLIEQDIPGHRICALTFTNKAAKEMVERVRDANYANTIRMPRIGGPFIGTFHSLGAKILRSEARSFGRTPNFAIFDDHDSFELIKRLLKKGGFETEEGPAFFRDRISAVKNGVAILAELQKSPTNDGRIATEILDNYERELEVQNAFDFDDLIQKVVVLFKKQPAVLKKYQQRFTHILIDEYQDLNNVQYDLIKLLAQSSKNLSVVGDDQQTIYSWRGSNLEIFLNFESDWPEPQVVLLEENYRSSANIIAAAQGIIAHNKAQKSKTLWTKNPAGAPLKVTELSDQNEEAEWIAEELKDGRWQMANGDQKPSVAILYRTNAQSRALEQALIERGIPYRIFGGIKFYERREIKDILAALRYASNPRDILSQERIQKTFPKRVAVELLESLTNKAEEPPQALISYFLKTTAYLDYLKKNFENPEERMENIGELVHFSAQFDELGPFLEQISLLQATDTPAKSKEQIANSSGNPLATSHSPFAVQLMTMHLAKGLEFDRVFVAGCSEGLLPHGRSLGSQAELEEERRLMYVAMTRAKQELCLSFYDEPSRFLFEIPQELVSFASLVSENNSLSDDEERYITLE